MSQASERKTIFSISPKKSVGLSPNVRSEARGSPVRVTCRCLRSEPNSCKLSLSTQIDESVAKILRWDSSDGQ